MNFFHQALDLDIGTNRYQADPKRKKKEREKNPNKLQAGREGLRGRGSEGRLRVCWFHFLDVFSFHAVSDHTYGTNERTNERYIYIYIYIDKEVWIYTCNDARKHAFNFSRSLLLKILVVPQEGFLSWTSGVSDNAIYPEPWQLVWQATAGCSCSSWCWKVTNLVRLEIQGGTCLYV